MTNNEMRAFLKDARTYNKSAKARQTWSTKVDAMHEQQVYEVFNRFDHCMHVYLVPTQIDGYPMGLFDTGKAWSYEDCAYGSMKRRNKVMDKFYAEYPEYANANICFVYREELPYKDCTKVQVKCNDVCAWRLAVAAKHAGLHTSQEVQDIVTIEGDYVEVLKVLIKWGLKQPTLAGYDLAWCGFKVEL